MALPPLLVLSVALLGSASGSSATSSRVTPLTKVVVAACMEGAGQTLTGELKTGLQQVQQQASALQEQQLERLETVQEQLQQQLAVLKEQLTAVQKQLTSDPRTGSCPANWIRRGDNCYLMPPEKATWTGALQACSAFDPRARLVSIHQFNKNSVNSLLKASGEDFVWIGLFRPPGIRIPGRSSWYWTDGAPMDYHNWAAAEPNNYQGQREFCAASMPLYMDENRAQGEWDDLNCERSHAFMCQISLKWSIRNVTCSEVIDTQCHMPKTFAFGPRNVSLNVEAFLGYVSAVIVKGNISFCVKSVWIDRCTVAFLQNACIFTPRIVSPRRLALQRLYTIEILYTYDLTYRL